MLGEILLAIVALMLALVGLTTRSEPTGKTARWEPARTLTGRGETPCDTSRDYGDRCAGEFPTARERHACEISCLSDAEKIPSMENIRKFYADYKFPIPFDFVPVNPKIARSMARLLAHHPYTVRKIFTTNDIPNKVLGIHRVDDGFAGFLRANTGESKDLLSVVNRYNFSGNVVHVFDFPNMLKPVNEITPPEGTPQDADYVTYICYTSKGVGHANSVVVRPKSKTAILIEPSIITNRKFDGTLVDINAGIKRILPGYKVYVMSKYPTSGLQGVTADHFCASWSVFLAELIYSNPRAEIPKLMDYLIGIGTEAGVVLGMYLEYLWGKYNQMEIFRENFEIYTRDVNTVNQRIINAMGPGNKYNALINVVVHFNNYILGIAATEYAKFGERVKISDLELITLVMYHGSEMRRTGVAQIETVVGYKKFVQEIFGDKVSYDILDRAIAEEEIREKERAKIEAEKKEKKEHEEKGKKEKEPAETQKAN